MNPILRYHILGKTYKNKISSDRKQTKGSGTAHKKDYDNVDMLDNVMGNIEKMKFEERKESPKIRTVKKSISGAGAPTKRTMPLKFKFTI